MKINIFTVTSSLHDEDAVNAVSDEFLSPLQEELCIDFNMAGADFSTIGTGGLDLIYIRTGGAEGIFRQLLPGMLAKEIRRFYLLTSGKSNSLPASLEILSYLRSEGLKGEVLHGNTRYLASRIMLLLQIEDAFNTLKNKKIGVIGKPSDWLIASHASARDIKEKLGVEMEDIPMEELLKEIAGAKGNTSGPDAPMKKDITASWPGAVKILEALRAVVEKHGLGALTLRCFDLLTSVGNTGCLALATLNSEGIPSSCEGDVPALLSMMIANALLGKSGFQANPSRIDTTSGEILFAHCTIPLDMVDSWCLDTHFESGIGVGIHGEFPSGPVTVFKVSGDLSRYYIAEGELICNQYEDNLCRTQILVRIDPQKTRYFLEEPIGNHHIVLPYRCAALLEVFMKSLQA